MRLAFKASNKAESHGETCMNRTRRSSHNNYRSSATPARKLAYDVLGYIRTNSVFLEQAWRACSKHVSLVPAERGFARLLATMVVSHKGALDALIDRVLNDPSDIQADVRDALRISFAELYYLNKPDHVAVNEGVKLVKSVVPKASGLANFALRRGAEAKKDFPFGDPRTDIEAVSLLFGFPLWLTKKLVDEFGYDSAIRFMKRSNEPAPLFFIINQASSNGPQVLKGLVGHGVKLAPIPRIQQSVQGVSCFVFAQRNEIASVYVEDLLAKGTLVISDGAAQIAASKAVPSSFPSSFLEIGAGRGTKSMLLQNICQSRFGKQMQLDCLDVDKCRTKERNNRLKQTGIVQHESFLQSATDLSNFEDASYDAVFIDAPCSGLGTLRRHPDIRWRVEAIHLTQFAHTGLLMLEQAARLVKPGGSLTYATCTVFSDENKGVIDTFLASEKGKDFTCESMELIGDLFDQEASRPSFDSHFICVLHKRAE